MKFLGTFNFPSRHHYLYAQKGGVQDTQKNIACESGCSVGGNIIDLLELIVSCQTRF